VIITDEEYADLKHDQQRCRFLMRAWATVSGRPIPEALAEIDQMIANIRRDGDGQQFERFLAARGNHTVRGRGKDRRREAQSN
jgi:hypothetical protein